MEENPKFNAELKQTAKGEWYVGSIRISTNEILELDSLMESATTLLIGKIDKLNKREFKPISSEVIFNDNERILFEKLRSMRMNLAQAEHIPPFIIMHDTVLKQIAKQKPQSNEEMLKIEGVGDKKLEKYGVYFLKVIQDYLQSNKN